MFIVYEPFEGTQKEWKRDAGRSGSEVNELVMPQRDTNRLDKVDNTSFRGPAGTDGDLHSAPPAGTPIEIRPRDTPYLGRRHIQGAPPPGMWMNEVRNGRRAGRLHQQWPHHGKI